MTAETRLAERMDVVTGKQQHSKHITTATNQHATTEELLEIIFSMWSMPLLYNEAISQVRASHSQ
jgi:hypothetical protein